MSLAPVLHSFAYTLNYLREQVDDDLPADKAAQPGGIANPPMWTLGHIAYSCTRRITSDSCRPGGRRWGCRG
jgi:hypothetical protein